MNLAKGAALSVLLYITYMVGYVKGMMDGGR